MMKSDLYEADVKSADQRETCGTYKQQELIDALQEELHAFTEKYAIDASRLEDKKTIKKALEVQLGFSSRLGSAAKIIGLKGLKRFCGYIQDKLSQVQSTKSYFEIESTLLDWPNAIYAYLDSPFDPSSIEEMIDFLGRCLGEGNLTSEERLTLKTDFINSKIEFSEENESDRIYKATPAHVSLSIAEEVSLDILESFLIDLPNQVELLVKAIRKLRSDNFIHELKMAERITHTLKGVGNTVGIDGITNMSHYLEEIFSACIRAKERPSVDLYHAIENAVDCLQEMSEYLSGAGQLPEESLQIFQDLVDWSNKIYTQGFIHATKQNAEDLVAEDSPVVQEQSEPEAHSITEEDQSVKNLSFRVSAKLIDDLLNRTSDTIVSGGQINDLISQLKASVNNLVAANKRVKIQAQELEAFIAKNNIQGISETKNTDSKFDSLELEQFHEMHTYFNQLLESADDALTYSSEFSSKTLKLQRYSTQQVRSLHENKDAILQARLVSVKSIAPRLRHSVRRACKTMNKLAELEISGEDTLMESETIHQLTDPIMHLLRNAIDHGIETPEQRVAQGKNKTGTIKLHFSKGRNTIHVTCEDNGRGLDIQRIQSKAVEQNLHPQNTSFDSDRATNMIFQHGFSTKDRVSHMSGRGVGLTAVYNKMRELKGNINVNDRRKNGMQVELTVPTYVNSLRALIAQWAGLKIAISNRGVNEILYPGAGKIISVAGKYYYEHLQQRYPVYDLQYLVRQSEVNLPASNKVVLLVSDNVNKTTAVVVDKIYETRDIIIKPISKLIPKVIGLQGSTIYGDGDIITVIDIVDLLDNVNSTRERYKQREPIQEVTTEENYALVVEDSISSRKALAQFLQDLGFVVRTAKDGVEALNQIQNQTPSLVITDLEMPRMNGLELCDHLRTNKATTQLPIVMLTSKTSIKHKQEASRLGVSAFVTKPYEEDELLEIINTFKIIPHVVP